MADVYFMTMRAGVKEGLLEKEKRLLREAGLDKMIKKGQLVAIKLHFGEKGNTAYIRPIFVRQVVDLVMEAGGIPFLTDTNTLYSGTRSDSVSHIRTAVENGFAYSVVNVPIIIADGLRGGSFKRIPVENGVIKEAFIGREIYDSDFLISLTHFKGHELSGFGGAIKNTGMGCASRKGKLEQHSGLSPKVKQKRCVGCGLCADHCSQKAITVTGKKASIDEEKCIGCGECIIICPNKAIDIQWSADIEGFMKKMVDYTKAVLSNKKGRAFFINFLTNISPACDCYGHSDVPICQDLGVLASADPVALDQASVDMVNKAPISFGHFLAQRQGALQDKFKALYPKVNWEIQLSYAESIGIGKRAYNLITIPEKE